MWAPYAAANDVTFNAGHPVVLDITARIVNFDDYGIDPKEYGDLTTPHSPAWELKQCCMVIEYNRNTGRNFSHDYCEKPKLVTWVAAGACGLHE